MASKKKYEIPAIADDASLDDILEFRSAAAAAIAEIDLSADEVPVEDIEAVEALDAHIVDLDARATTITEAEAALTARLTAARERAAAATAEPEADPEPNPEAEVEPEVEAEVEPEPVLASGTRRPTVARAAKASPTVIIKKDEPRESLTTITAAANVSAFHAGQELNGLDDLAVAFLDRVGGFGGTVPKDMVPGTYQMSSAAQKFGVAKIERKERNAVVDKHMSLEEQFAVISGAGKEATPGSLIATGGWCAPSETIYNLEGYETPAGLLDVPEVTARRGGISFTKGPDFMTVFADANSGFIQTEAQAIAGSTQKPCYALACPPFTEVRLDAVGFCATAPLLTDAAYPELVKRVLGMLTLGHARRKSASTITRILASMAAAVTFAPVGAAGSQSGIADALGAAELRANQIRQTLAMDPKATIEGFAPYWALGAFRTDLSRRLGLSDPFNVPDSAITNWFAIRGIKFQYVYDYQMLGTGAVNTAGGTATWTKWPEILEFALYPAGAYTRLVNDVISLNAVYDHDLLTDNEYTAAFVEEGMAVANTKGFGLRTSVALNHEGSAGYPAIGTGVGISVGA